jgi:hypothetical protein
VRTYGTEAFRPAGRCEKPADLGRDFGAGLTEAEVNWLVRNEYARSAQDILWRRTKLGLHMNDEQVRALDDFVAARMRRRCRGGRRTGEAETCWNCRACRAWSGAGCISTRPADLAEGHDERAAGADLSGKTSLMRLMAGLDQPTTGRIWERAGRDRPCACRTGASPWSISSSSTIPA